MDERDIATANVARWLQRQLRQPTPDREHLEAAVEHGDTAEVRRLLARHPFTDDQRRYLEDLMERWETALHASQ
ncbi:MAG TPA: hypothetical protein VIE40_01315 [Dehalococcoidia bacterium]